MELGFTEILVIALAIVILFGPDKIPQIARDLGTGVRKMKSAVDDIKSEILTEADNPISEIKKEIEKVKDAAKEYNPSEIIKNELDIAEKTTVQNKVEQLNDAHDGPVTR